jgi:ubiquinone biosynthesis protein COQ9
MRDEGVTTMFEEFSNRNRAIRAALELAAERGWNEVTFPAIAERTRLSLADLRRDFTCKTDILRAFQQEVDAEVLRKIGSAGPDQSPRDRLFDVLMTRFEVMAPFKPGLARIFPAICYHASDSAALLCSTLASQYWMLVSAGASSDGAGTSVRVTGLTAIYTQVFRTWLDDSTPGLDRTMAALDRKLRRGEDWLRGFESVCRFACGFVPRGWRRQEPEARPETPPAPAPVGPAPAPGPAGI